MEREIGKMICDIWDKVYNRDVFRTPRSGAFADCPGDLLIKFKSILQDYIHECKNEKSIHIKEYIKQCLQYNKWVIYFKYKNYGNFSVLPTEDLLQLFKTIDDLENIVFLRVIDTTVRDEKGNPIFNKKEKK